MITKEVTLTGVTTAFRLQATAKLPTEPGLYAIAGPNGAGKTTLLTAMMVAPLYRTWPGKRGSFTSRFVRRDSVLESRFSHNGHEWRALLQVDRGASEKSTAKTEAWLFRDGEALNNGKTKTFDEVVRDHFPEKDIVLASVFAEQHGSGSFGQLSEADRRVLLRKMLGLDRYQVIHEEAKAKAKGLTQQLVVIEAEAKIAAQRAEDAKAVKADHEAATKAKFKAELRFNEISAELATVQQRISGLEREISALEAAAKNYADNSSRLLSGIGKAEASAKHWGATLAKALKDSAFIVDWNYPLEETIKEADEVIATAEKDKATEVYDLGEHRLELSRLERGADKWTQALKEADAKAETFNALIADKATIEANADKAKAATEKLAEIKATGAEKRQKVDEKRREVAKMRQEVAERDEKARSLLHSAQVEQSAELAKQERALAVLSEFDKIAIPSIESCETEIAEAARVVGHRKQNKAAAESAYNTAAERTANAKAKLPDAERLRIVAKSKMDQAIKTAKILGSDCDDCSGGVPCGGEGEFAACPLISEAVSARDSINGLIADWQNKTATVEAITSKIAELELASYELFSKLEDTKQGLVWAEQVLTEAKQDLVAERISYARYSSAIEDRDEAKRALADIDERIAFVRKEAQLVDESKTALQAEEHKLGYLESDLNDDRRGRILEELNALGDVSTRLDSLRIAERDIHTVLTDFDHARQKVKDREWAIGELQPKITAATKEIAKLTEFITEQKSNREFAAEELAKSNIGLAEAKRTAATAEQMVKTATANKAELDSELSKLEEPNPEPLITAKRLHAESIKAEAEIMTRYQPADESLQNAKTALDRVSGKLEYFADADEKSKKTEENRQQTARQLAALERLSIACGPKGIQALEIDSASPEISDYANQLLADVVPKFSVELVTTRSGSRGKQHETLRINVHNAEESSTIELSEVSGGELAVIEEAIKLSISIFVSLKSGAQMETLYRDESDGGLSPEWAELYPAMLRKAMKIGGFKFCYFISHRPSLVSQADGVIQVSNGKIREEAQ